MSSVQTIGVPSILARYDKVEGEAWAIYQGREFIVSGMGKDVLSDWLYSFEAAGSTAIYTLRVYDYDEPPTSSEAAAGYLARINFKIVDTYEGAGVAGYGRGIGERLDKIEKRLAGFENDETEPESESLNDIIMGWLQEPTKLGQVVGAVRQALGKGAGNPVPAQIGQQTIGSAFDPADKEAALQRLAKAIDTLEKSDPKLVEHLEKLAQLSANDKLTFGIIIAKLDAL